MAARLGMRSIAIMGAILVLSACGGKEKDPKLLNIRSASRAPDEFTVLPTKPLQLPEDLASLPEPTPVRTNITDPTPEADAVAALAAIDARPFDGWHEAGAFRFRLRPAGHILGAASVEVEWRACVRPRPFRPIFGHPSCSCLRRP